MSEFKSDVEILKDIVGVEMYEQIKNEFGGASIYIPKNDKDIDYAPIYADIEAGLSFKLIAKKYNYTVVWVQKIYHIYRSKKFPKKQEIQHSLF